MRNSIITNAKYKVWHLRHNFVERDIQNGYGGTYTLLCYPGHSSLKRNDDIAFFSCFDNLNLKNRMGNTVELYHLKYYPKHNNNLKESNKIDMVEAYVIKEY